MMESKNKYSADVKVISGNNSLLNNADAFSESLVSYLEEDEIKKINFDSKNSLKDFLKDFVVGKINNEYQKLTLPSKEIKDVINETLKKCESVLEKDILRIYVFPTYSKFTIERMNCVNGFCVGKGVILIGLYPKGDWKKEISFTLTHELAHAISPYYEMSSLSIGEGIVFDGLAENFRMKFLGGNVSPWASSISEKEAITYFKGFKDKLDNNSSGFYREVFFGSGKYPLWTGYTIGYYLVKKYLENLKEINWREILIKNPKDILKKIV